MANTDLLVENGQLLKSYSRPWRPEGWGAPPPGWTAADDEWIAARAQELMDGWRKVLDQEPTPDIAYNQARQERGQHAQDERRPWAGWVPTNPRADPKVTKAYRELFKAINDDLNFPMPTAVLEKKAVRWPPDGRYVFSKGKMIRMHEQQEMAL